MKKILYIMCMCVLALGLLSGCGGEFAEEMEAGKDASRALTGSAVSECNVSGQAVSGQSVSGQSIQTDGEKNSAQGDFRRALDSRYCTERYYYTMSFDDDEDEEGNYVAQISLETGKRRKFRIDDGAHLVCVDRDALYCTMPSDSDNECYSSLWQIPIERLEDGSEELKTDRWEMVKGLDDIYYEEDDIYVDDTYIVYSGNKGGGIAVIRYDRASGEKVSMPVTKEVQKCIECDIARIYRRGDCMEFVTAGGIATWDVRTENVSACVDENLSEYLDVDDELVSTERACFYLTGVQGWDVLRIDMETKKKTDFVSEKEFWSVLETKTGIRKKQVKSSSYMSSLYYDENCLYIEACVEYENEGKVYDRDIILSREDTEGAPLQYEKGLTEYMWNGNEKRNLHEDDYILYSEACFYGISQGMAEVCWGWEEDLEDVIYDLNTGKTRPFSWKDDLIFQ